MSTSYRIGLGKRLREVRESMCMTQKEFCLFFSPVVKSPSMISEYENGESTPPLEVFFLLARADINMNWLFTGNGIMREPRKGGPRDKDIAALKSLSDILRTKDAAAVKAIMQILATFEKLPNRVKLVHRR